MFNCFIKKVDLKKADFWQTLDLNKITTIEECRDMIIILAHTINGGNSSNILRIRDKALIDYPSLTKLKL